jgi:hypothetical protein
MRENTLSEGDEVALTFIRESRITGTERRTVEVEVREAMGDVVVFENPYGESDPLIVVDPEDDVWARDPDTLNDGFYGRNASIEA